MSRQRKPLPHILVLYTGGTFGMSPGLRIRKQNTRELKQNLMKSVPELGLIAQCTIEVVSQIDSCQMHPGNWIALAQYIQTQLQRHKKNPVQGVVILHGTDTLSYTAAALSYLLSPSPIPVVLTGAQRPLSALRNDARGNLISAVEVAAHAPAPLQNRVMVLFHDHLYLGSRVRKKSAQDFDAFESPRFPPLATIGTQIDYQPIIHTLPRLKKNPALARLLKSNQFQKSAGNDPQILVTEVTPSTPRWIEAALTRRSPEKPELDAALITLYPSATAPTEHASFMGLLAAFKRARIPVYAVAEREGPSPRLDLYPSGQELKSYGVLWGGSMTPEAAWVKIWLTQLLDLSWNPALSDERSL